MEIAIGLRVEIHIRDLSVWFSLGGEFSSMYLRVEGTKSGPLDCYLGLSYDCVL